MTTFSYNPLDQNPYTLLRFNILKGVEENNDLKKQAYLDSKQIPTIGLGMNLRDQNVRSAVIDEIVKNYEGLISEAEKEQIKTEIATVVNKIFPKTDDGVSRLQSELNGVIKKYVESATFTFANEEQIKAVFDIVVQTYESRIDNWLSNIPPSQERAVLLSLSYNGLLAESNSLKSAIQNGNRPEAWYEIRYQSNGDKSRGIAKRRYYESQLFGLYDNANSVSEAESKSVFAMYTKNRGKIKDYDNLYPEQIEKANIDYNYKVENFEESIAKARQVLVGKYGAGRDAEIDEILVDLEGTGINRENYKKTSNALIIGSDESEIIRTGKGSNIVNSFAGQDRIYSSSGSNSNILLGGEGLDTYYFSTLSGNDIIEDIDKDGKIQIGNVVVTGNANPKTDINGNVIEGVWSFGGFFDLHKKGSDLVIVKAGLTPELETVGKVTIKNYDFNSKNVPFGINLNGKFLKYGNVKSYQRTDPAYSTVFYYPVFSTKDPKGSFLSFVQKVDESGVHNLAVQTFNQKAELLSFNWLTNARNTKINDKEYTDQSLGIGQFLIAHKLENGNIVIPNPIFN